jgi:hypothetical protein
MLFQQQQNTNSPQLLKCIAFCDPQSSKHKLSKVIEFIETQKHNKEYDIFIYTSIEHIRFANESKSLLGSLLSTTSPPRKTEIIIDPTDYTSVENFKPFIYSFPENYSPFQIVIIVSESVQKAEIILFPYLFTVHHALSLSSSPTTEQESYLNGRKFIKHKSSSKRSKIMLKPECLIFCCFSYHHPTKINETPIKLSFLSIRDEISHSQKFHESPLFPFPFKIQNLDLPSP